MRNSVVLGTGTGNTTSIFHKSHWYSLGLN